MTPLPTSTPGKKAASRHRIFICVFAFFLVLPGLTHLFGKKRVNSDENRALVEVGPAPQSQKELFAYPAKVDAYLNDHFGLRASMIRLNNRLRYAAFGELNSVQLTAGKDGFVFFNSHAASEPMGMINYLCGKDLTPAKRATIAAGTTEFMRAALQRNPNSHMLIAPTKSVIYQDKLPDWLQAECAAHTATVPAVMALLAQQPDMQGRIIYPLQEMMALKEKNLLYPKLNFHWAGEGAQLVAELIAQDYLKRPKLMTFATRELGKPSDLQHFAPGVSFDIRVKLPDYAAAGIQTCDGLACFPEFGSAAAKLGDISRFTHTGRKGPRLLIVSDSFGHDIAGQFSEYFGEVWHLSVNQLPLLTPEELRRTQAAVFEQYRPDEVLYIFHDFSLAYFFKFATRFVSAKG